jgi:hypothetical protein
MMAIRKQRLNGGRVSSGRIIEILAGSARLMILLLCFAAPVFAASAPDIEERKAEPKTYRSGFYMGLNMNRIIFDPDLDDRSSFTKAGVELDGTRAGAGATFGYGFGPHFESQIRVMFFEGGGATEDISPVGAYFAWDTIMPITNGSRLRPFVAAGFGGLLLLLDKKSEDNLADLALDFRFVILNFEREVNEDMDDASGEHIGGGGSMHYLTFSLSHDF